MKTQIPAIIHYCWFGGKPLPELAQKCMASWRRFCPGFEIKEWNEKNFDISACAYVKEAYQAKKWAFVSDYARFHILYQQGGLYFDTDVELIKPLDDLLAQGGFMGIERTDISVAPGFSLAVNPGLGLAASPGLKIYQEVLAGYHTRHFRKSDGTLDTMTVVQYTTNILKQHGLQDQNRIQQVADIVVYPKDYFCPMDSQTGALNITENTRAIHHFSGSWLSASERFISRVHGYCKSYGRVGKCIQFVLILWPRIWVKSKKMVNAWLYQRKHSKRP